MRWPEANRYLTENKDSVRIGGYHDMKKVAVVIRDRGQQYDGLRTSVGALLNGAKVFMVVLNHEIENMDEAFRDNMGFLDDMGGERISNHMANAEKYGFQHATLREIARKLKTVDLIIPF